MESAKIVASPLPFADVRAGPSSISSDAAARADEIADREASNVTTATRGAWRFNRGRGLAAAGGRRS